MQPAKSGAELLYSTSHIHITIFIPVRGIYTTVLFPLSSVSTASDIHTTILSPTCCAFTIIIYSTLSIYRAAKEKAEADKRRVFGVERREEEKKR